MSDHGTLHHVFSDGVKLPPRARGSDRDQDLLKSQRLSQEEQPSSSNTASVAVGTDDVDVVLSALRERDIDRPENLVGLATSDAILGACRWYDERRRQGATVGAGLLVNCIREGGKPGYGAQPSRPTLPVTPKLLNAVRGACLSPDGCRRGDMSSLFVDAAGRRGLTADELIDQAVGPNWQLTPPHPGLLQHGDGRRWERYERWLSSSERPRPDVTVQREPGEELLAFCSRFWNLQQLGSGSK